MCVRVYMWFVFLCAGKHQEALPLGYPWDYRHAQPCPAFRWVLGPHTYVVSTVPPEPPPQSQRVFYNWSFWKPWRQVYSTEGPQTLGHGGIWHPASGIRHPAAAMTLSLKVFPSHLTHKTIFQINKPISRRTEGALRSLCR